MATIKLSFWNVQNLFWPGSVARGPNKPGELDHKVDRLAQCINRFFSPDMPDLVGLAEVQDEPLARKLVSKLNGNYDVIWEHAPVGTGLGVLVNSATVASARRVSAYAPSALARPRAVIVECVMRQTPVPFLLVLNHWRSRMPRRPGDAFSPARDRRETADWIRSQLLSPQQDPVFLIGDFNAEPTESPFADSHLAASRHFPVGSNNSRFYNTAWRFLHEPLYWEDRHARAAEARPKRTFDGYPPAIFDQLLVSRQALNYVPFGIRESTVKCYVHDKVNSRQNRNGVLFPEPWQFRSAADFEGASDHYPLLAEVEIR